MSHTTTPTIVPRRARLGRRAAAALLGAAALTGLTTVTAPTAGAATWDHTYSGKGVTVYVKERGDIIKVCDTSKNGHSAWVAVMDISNNIDHYKLKASGGKGTCATHRASEGGRYDLAEYSRIALNYEGAGGNGSYYVSYVNDH
ncbi:hypothetical protein [Streptomyces sp. NPDC056987]|uniref:hypothetical protein n=1 Tax=Streptomyces sp. NPDC056987 TaxID=3345988 RepID=UPI00362C9A37